MAESTKLTIRIPIETMNGLELLEEKTGRTIGSVAAAAITEYVGYELKFVEGVEAGQEDLRNGRVTPNEDVRRQVRELIDTRRNKV